MLKFGYFSRRKRPEFRKRRNLRLPTAMFPMLPQKKKRSSFFWPVFLQFPEFGSFQKGRKGAGVKGAGVANCRIFRSAVPSVVVWSILLVSLSGVKKKL